MTTGTADSWKVKLDDGQVRTLTLDQLDEGYKDGWIRGRTPVLPEGGFVWKPLRDVAGLDPSGSHQALPAADALDIQMPSEAPLRKTSSVKIVVILLVALVAAAGIVFAAMRAAPSIKVFVTSHLPGSKTAPAQSPAKEAPKPPDPPAPAPPAVQAQAQTAAPPATMNAAARRTIDAPSAKKKGKRR
jgi:hypothetical protein